MIYVDDAGYEETYYLDLPGRDGRPAQRRAFRGPWFNLIVAMNGGLPAGTTHESQALVQELDKFVHSAIRSGRFVCVRLTKGRSACTRYAVTARSRRRAVALGAVPVCVGSEAWVKMIRGREFTLAFAQAAREVEGRAKASAAADRIADAMKKTATASSGWTATSLGMTMKSGVAPAAVWPASWRTAQVGPGSPPVRVATPAPPAPAADPAPSPLAAAAPGVAALDSFTSENLAEMIAAAGVVLKCLTPFNTKTGG